MALVYQQFVYGFAITTGSNDKLDFVDAGVTYAATLRQGNYTAGAFAAEVQRAMRAIQGGSSNGCTFAYATLLFTLTGTSTFSLLTGSGANVATSCATLLGLTSGGGAGNDSTGSTAYSTQVVGTAPSTASLWTLAEPSDYITPVTAQTDGTAALLTRREITATQNVTDGKAIETIYLSTLKHVVVGFRALTAAEQTKMETFLNWAERGRPFGWQPNKTSGNALRLRWEVGNGTKIDNEFTWLTRSEADYARLTFLEDITA